MREFFADSFCGSSREPQVDNTGGKGWKVGHPQCWLDVPCVVDARALALEHVGEIHSNEGFVLDEEYFGTSKRSDLHTPPVGLTLLS